MQNLSGAEIDETIGKVEELVTKNGGKVLEIERWEKKRLAYPVKKHKYGYYVLIRLEAPANLIDPLERFYRLSEHIIKFLTIKITDLKKQTDSVSLPENDIDNDIDISKNSDHTNKNDQLEETNNSKN